jgi:putative transposase
MVLNFDRHEFTRECLFLLAANLPDAKTKIGAWREEYNLLRPHSSLDYLTPDEFADRILRTADR